MAKKNDKPEPPADKKDPATPPATPAAAAGIGVKVKMLVTAQGPDLRLMTGHVHVLPKAQAEAYIEAGAAELYTEKAVNKKAEDRETR